jgi:hypothetical protein
MITTVLLRRRVKGDGIPDCAVAIGGSLLVEVVQARDNLD